MTTGIIQQPQPPLDALPAPGRVRRWHILVLVALTVASLALFVNRAFNVDEPLFIWSAQHIRQHPLDFYGFAVNWYTATASMSQVMKNPPLASYFIALASTVVGWSEVGLHIAFWLPALGLVLGIYCLARQLTSRPLLSALLALYSPFVLISATSVMCDILMLCLWVWAIVLWVEGLRRDRFRWLILAAFLAGAAALTKYFGVSLLPLMLAVGLLHKRRPGKWTTALVLPIAMLVAYQLWTGSNS
jgi:4-amino-4-deoxy-L-arabinose transferase-like glycosyltransferase